AAKGTEIVVCCEGDDAADALAALAKLIEAGFGEK
ncbi:MAG: HPr family phosphocarrier protein, partial [Anaeromyxobacteraceae bacterium]